MTNPILQTDSYKISHRQQYPPNTTKVYSNWTPRDSRIEGQTEVVFFGLQYFLQKHLMDEFATGFFAKDADEVCDRYESRVNGYLGPNTVGTSHIRALHDLGYLPLEFKALPEGTKVPLRVPMFTVENTHPEFAWLVNYFETLLSCVIWLPCTSATTASRYRTLLDRKADETGADPTFVDWQGHDFSMRGMCGPEAAALSGAGHLLFFTGSDTIPAVELVEDYYGYGFEPSGDAWAGNLVKSLPPEYLIGGSVTATEHSVMCAGGKLEEIDTFERLLDIYPTGIVSVVSDTWDLFGVISTILPKLKDRILGRDGKLVIRPDSGDPISIICGDPSAPIGSPAHKGVVELLWETFGGTITDKGYKVLDSHIGCIYGDSITEVRCRAICENLAKKGFASSNMVYGIGSFTYTYTTRDVYGFAMKATWVEVDGEGRDIFKDPVTDSGLKKSAKGRLAVVHDEDDVLSLIDQATPEQEEASLLKPVWRDGAFVRRQSFADVRAQARS